MSNNNQIELRSRLQPHLWTEYKRAYNKGVRKFDLMGGRRSGKTYFILQLLLGKMAQGDIVSVASMTSEQGRLGAYQDTKDILAGSPQFAQWCNVFTSPREIRCGKGRMFFHSYQDPERAKGIACDWLYINEGNNFSEKQYIDLSASVRKGVFVDRNPNSECWTEKNGFCLIHSTWQHNRANLSPQQIEWFEMLKRKAETPDATSADIAFYKMYYLGEYAEILGDIFTPANIQTTSGVPDNLRHYFIFADPSALRGADYFAMCVGATDGQRVYILDTFSENSGGYQLPATKIKQWRETYPIESVFVETNGLQGIEFYEFCQNSDLDVEAWHTKGNKFERITENYQGITEKVVFVQSEQLNDYLAQVYNFARNCEHDDNIDAVNSLYNAYKWNALI